jgi:uncharacterized protein (DUF1684 family)
MGGAGSPQELLDLVDWRRRVGDLYRTSGLDTLEQFRQRRDGLMRNHPQSPIPVADREAFRRIDYFSPDLSFRVAATLTPSPSDDEIVIQTNGPDGDIHYRRGGLLNLTLRGVDCSLTVFSLVGYGGGLFLPFRDSTSGKQTYGGGRYLFDTIKNTDGLVLEVRPGSTDVVVDFNYAYNPSCAYDPHWACPLAPRENWLSVPVEAGERVYPGLR